MRLIFFSLLLSGFYGYSQDVNYVKKVYEIAAMERDGHQRLIIAAESSFASDNFDVKYYRCEWDIDPAIRFIKGKITIYFTVSSAASSITLDMMSPLVADSVKQHNTLLGFSQPSNTLQVMFSPAINSGTLDSISIFYKGVPPNTGFGSFVLGTHAGVPVMWSLSEPYGSRDWWPCKNGLNDKADSIDILITHPLAYKAASNGLLQTETLNGGTKITTHWKHRYPIATYLICFAVTNYTVFNNTVMLGSNNLPMVTYCYPESLVVFQNNTQKVLDAMALFHNNFGDYPFIREKYGHVQFGWGGGMEHQTSTFLVSPDESLMAHELGHQWFGDKITCGSWEDIWLNEGFATHLAAFHMENKYPASAISNRRNIVNNITSQPGGSVRVNDTTSVGRIFDGRLSYNKGSHLLFMLRFILGDSIFFNGIRQYQKDPALMYGFARTPDLKRNLEQASGKDLTTFFNQWYNGEGYPSYNVKWSQIGSRNVRIQMNQVTSHSSVSFFELPVALKFKNASQEKTVVVDNKTNGEVFIRNIGFIADTVLVDPEYWLITRNNITSKVPYISNGQGSVDFANPVTDPLNLYFHDFNESSALLTIYNTTGQLIYTRKISLINGAELVEVPSRSWARGVYIIKVTAGSSRFVKRVMK